MRDEEKHFCPGICDLSGIPLPQERARNDGNATPRSGSWPGEGAPFPEREKRDSPRDFGWKLFFGGFVGVFLLEALDAAGGIDQFLLAGEKGMATGADFDSDQFAFLGGAGLERASAGAVNSYSVIIGMDSFFHWAAPVLGPVCAAPNFLGGTQPRR
jgi:hypothetical protein